MVPDIATNDLASSVVNLLRGAGLLSNIAEIAEKKRSEDEHLLTDKLEMVKGIMVIQYMHRLYVKLSFI